MVALTFGNRPIALNLGENTGAARRAKLDTESALAETQELRDQAEAFVLAIQLLGAGVIYETAADGVDPDTGVALNRYFVTWEEGGLRLYVNTAGAAVAKSELITMATVRALLAASNGASLVGFTQSGTGADPETVQDALRREVWADQYKLIIDADDTNCVTRAVTAMLAGSGGGIVRLSRRPYTFNAGITFTGLNNVRIVGAGKSSTGTMIRETFTSGDGITFIGCQSCELSGVLFWPTVRKTGGYSAAVSLGSYDCFMDFRTDFGWNGLNINGASETRYKVNTRYMLGTIGVRFGGTFAFRSYRSVAEDQLSDNPYPVAATVTNAKTWTSGMTLVAGDHFVSNGAVYQCVTGGTAGASAPSGYPSGTTPESVFFTNITTGTAAIRWICNASQTHLVQDSYGYSLVIEKAALLNGAVGFQMADTANTGTSYPIWAFAIDLETDHSYVTGIDLARGEGFFDAGICWVGSCLSGNGVVIGPNFRGNVAFGPASRVMGNAQHGILRQAGPQDVRICGTEVADNSISSSGTYNGLHIAAGSVDTQVNGGRLGDSVSVAGNATGWGVAIGNGCDKTSIIGTNVRGNSVGGIFVGTGQTNLTIRDCPGYNGSALAPITVTASPFTWTNNTGADASVNIAAGTVSLVTLDGYAVGTSTDRQVLVPNGSALVVTYSSVPTMLRRIL